MTTFQTWYKSYLTEYINTTATTIPVSTLPTATNGRMMIYQGTTQEWIDYTWITGTNPTGSLTGCSRWMSQTAEPSTSGTGLEWPAGSQIINVQMHDQIVSKGLPLPIIALTTVERDAIDMWNDYFDESNPIIYNTTAGEYQYWNGSAWTSFATWTVPDATNLVGGKVKLSTADAGNTGVVLNSTDDRYVALAGTSGTPSTSNKYVTNDDTATDATASKVARRLAGGNITVVTETAGNNTTNAASTAFVTAAVTSVTPKIYVDAVPGGTSISGTLYTQSITANTFTANSEMVVRISILYWNASSGTGTLNIKFGGVTIWTANFWLTWWADTPAQVEVHFSFDATTWVCNRSAQIFWTSTVSTAITPNTSTADLTSSQTFTIDGSRTGSGWAFTYYTSSMIKI